MQGGSCKLRSCVTPTDWFLGIWFGGLSGADVEKLKQIAQQERERADNLAEKLRVARGPGARAGLCRWRVGSRARRRTSYRSPRVRRHVCGQCGPHGT